MSKQNNNKLEAKKNAVLNKKSKWLPVVIISACAALAIAIIVLVNAAGDNAGTAVLNAAPAVKDEPVVKYPVSLFDDKKAKFYQYKKDKITINYFILKSSDGVIRAAFDACDVCWRAGKGYRQDGDEMVCRNCGRRFESVRINEVEGGCNPAPLKRSIDNGNVIINVSDMLEGARFFKN